MAVEKKSYLTIGVLFALIGVIATAVGLYAKITASIDSKIVAQAAAQEKYYQSQFFPNERGIVVEEAFKNIQQALKDIKLELREIKTQVNK